MSCRECNRSGVVVREIRGSRFLAMCTCPAGEALTRGQSSGYDKDAAWKIIGETAKAGLERCHALMKPDSDTN